MRLTVQMSIEEAEHYTAEQRSAILASYPEWEREARAHGVPILGSGRVFPLAESEIVTEGAEIPEHWPQIIGVDFGWDHPFAAVNLAWDRENDCVYLTREYAAREATPAVHAAALLPWGRWIPVAWPQDGLQHEKGSGLALRELYAAQGLNMLGEPARFADGGLSVEAGILAMLDRMRSGRLKVFRHLGGWLAEFRLYHRKEGILVKRRDDHIAASRYALMMLRFATTRPPGAPLRRRITGYA